MKKQTLFLACIFVSVPLFSLWASGKKLTCPRAEQIEKYVNTVKPDSADCENWQNQATSFTDPEAFPFEIKAFQNDVITLAKQDNSHDTNFTAHKLVYELRQHHRCMLDLCQAVLMKCGNRHTQDLTTSQYLLCRQKIDPLFLITPDNPVPLQTDRVRSAHNTVQERKTRSTVLEKFRAMEVRSRHFLVDQNIKLITNFTRMRDKITALLFKPM